MGNRTDEALKPGVWQATLDLLRDRERTKKARREHHDGLLSLTLAQAASLSWPH